MEENMESLYTWFPLVSIGLLVLGIVLGYILRGSEEEDQANE